MGTKDTVAGASRSSRPEEGLARWGDEGGGGSENETAKGAAMGNKDAVVDVCNTHAEAEHVILQLQKAGFDMKKLSIVGKNRHDEKQVIGYYKTGDQMKHWGTTGAFWGGWWGMLSGSAFFVVPEIGPILVAGPLAAAMVGALEQTAAVGGLNALGVGLYNLGIPQNSITNHEAALKQGKFLVIAHGSAADVAMARDILMTTPAVAR